MMVVVIIGILAAVAVPSYRDYIVNAKSAEGYVVVDAIAKNQKVFYLEKDHFYGLQLENFGDQYVNWLYGSKVTFDENSGLRHRKVVNASDPPPDEWTVFFPDGTATYFISVAAAFQTDSSGSFISLTTDNYIMGDIDAGTGVLGVQNGRTVCFVDGADPVPNSVLGINESPSGKYSAVVIAAIASLDSDIENGGTCLVKTIINETGDFIDRSTIRIVE